MVNHVCFSVRIYWSLISACLSPTPHPAQLRRAYPSLEFRNVRGNLNTRLAKLDNGEEYDALILARAGIERMGWQDRLDETLGGDVCLYAVGQVCP